MKVELAYGVSGLTIDVPDGNLTIIEPTFVPGVEDEAAALMQSLQWPMGCKPLADMASALAPSDKVAIVVCDATRPVPNKRIFPIVLGVLEKAGVSHDQIVIVNALGTHRPSPEHELIETLGEKIVSEYRIVQHDCNDRSQMACVGRLSTGSELWLNAEYVDAALRIAIGFIEPHFFAGFSGGPKLVLPGIASLENVMEAHSFTVLDSPGATWGITRGNPVHELIREAASMARPQMSLNVTLNRNKEITAVFAGDLDQAHNEGTSYIRRVSMQPADEPFDIVITTNSGYPLDRNLYQAVKGICAAASVVREGGAIIASAQCVDGVPSGSHYQQILQRSKSPAGAMKLISTATSVMPDQWQVQLQARVQLKADVYLYSECLTDDEIVSSMFIPCRDIEATLNALIGKMGENARICVLPEGPQTIPYLVK